MAGHPQFAPDHLVTLIANAYNRKDIFTDAEHKFSRSVQSSVQPFIEDGSNICGMEKCIVCQVFRKMHSFLIIHSDNKVIMKMRRNCHVGTLMASPLSVVDSPQSRIPPECYISNLHIILFPWLPINIVTLSKVPVVYYTILRLF